MKQVCTYTFEHLDEIEIPQKGKITKTQKDEIDNLHSPVTLKEIEFAIEKFLKKEFPTSQHLT